MWGKTAYDWNTMLTGRRFGGTPATSAPSMRISPEVGVSNPASIRRRVVLPQPEGPRRAKSSPSGISRSTESTAGSPAPKRLVTPRISTIGRPDGGAPAPPDAFVHRIHRPSRAPLRPCIQSATAVMTRVIAMRIVDAAFTSGVTENRTIE